MSKFQSTLPTRGSDGGAVIPPQRKRNFNPRSPRGGATWRRFYPHVAGSDFNPRSPRGGATDAHAPAEARGGNFNPRSPRGGATAAGVRYCDETEISIHAPHEGERRSEARRANARIRISIHAPHEGERPGGDYTKEDYSGFQSTLPTRGSDYNISR